MTTNRKKQILRAYSAGDKLNGKDYDSRAAKILEERFSDDACRDVTTESVLKKNVGVRGMIKAKADGILAGLAEISKFYARHGVKVKALKKDGASLKKGGIIAKLYGKEADFLKVERTGLNMLQRMSGIATQTKKLADMVRGFGVKIVGTRKTVLNYPDKKAIYLGGGLPHRMGLYDAILIKDNHLSAIREEGTSDPIETALARAFSANLRDIDFIEIEVASAKDALKAAKKYVGLRRTAASKTPFIIMFDNMTPKEIKNAVSELKADKLYGQVLLEASGGIDESNIRSYARTGVDAISVGVITHSVRALDISQKIISREKLT